MVANMPGEPKECRQQAECCAEIARLAGFDYGDSSGDRLHGPRIV